MISYWKYTRFLSHKQMRCISSLILFFFLLHRLRLHRFRFVFFLFVIFFFYRFRRHRLRLFFLSLLLFFGFFFLFLFYRLRLNRLLFLLCTFVQMQIIFIQLNTLGQLPNIHILGITIIILNLPINLTLLLIISFNCTKE